MERNTQIGSSGVMNPCQTALRRGSKANRKRPVAMPRSGKLTVALRPLSCWAGGERSPPEREPVTVFLLAKVAQPLQSGLQLSLFVFGESVAALSCRESDGLGLKRGDTDTGVFEDVSQHTSVHIAR